MKEIDPRAQGASTMPSKALPVVQSWLIGAAVALFALVMAVLDPRPVEVLRLAGFDQMQRAMPRKGGSDGVVVVEIDEASLRELGQWPWPRTRLAQFVATAHAQRAVVVAMDVLLAEPDRTSPREAAAHWPDSPALQRWLTELPDHDHVLAHALRLAYEGGRTATVLGLSLDVAGRRMSAEVPVQWVHRGTPRGESIPLFPAVLMPIPTLAGAATGLGAINFIGDGDGVVRRVPLLLDANGRWVPSLTLESLRLRERRSQVQLDWSPGLEQVRVGPLTLPATDRGEMWVHFGDPNRFTRLSFADVVANRVPADALAGKVVLLGASAKGLLDLRFTPRGDLIPGVYVHAEALTQVLAGQALARPWWLPPLEWLVCVLAVVLAYEAALRLGAGVGLSAGTAVAAASVAVAAYAFHRMHLLVDASLIVVSALLAAALGGTLRNQVAERQARWIRSAFSRYISPNIVEHLVDQPGQLGLGGRRQVCSFVFTDLQGFTHLVETLDPAQVAQLVNPYLEGMIRIAFKHGGTLDRIVGDAVAVMFSAPVVQADHARRAVACAAEMATFANTYTAAIEARGGTFGRVRIGVHCGEVIVGNFGGESLFDYRALGDAVNVTARLETANKYFGTQVCLSTRVLDAVGIDAPATRPVGRVVFQGKSEALEVRALDQPEDTMREWAPAAAYAQAFAAIATLSPAAALVQFEQICTSHPADALARFQAQRLRAGAQDDRILLESK